MSFSWRFCLVSPFHNGVQKANIVLKKGYSSNLVSILFCISIGFSLSLQSSILLIRINFKFFESS